ncbi:MAG: PAS/PAC and GAF sensor-containing diguanylate cyclase [Chloroflexi bacterium]|nr:MAG: PAS/PAC and GAF sensor-containing diguanylate cyclase [Chloroflexota bacterium]
MTETIFPLKNKYSISGLLVLMLVFFIALAAICANAALRRIVKESDRAEHLLLLLNVHAYHLSALEWQSIGEGHITTELVENLENARNDMEQLLRELEQLDPDREGLLSVRRAYSTYVSAISEEIKLVSEGDFDQAWVFDEEQVDPAFESFIQILDEVSAHYHAKVEQVEQVDDIGSALVLVLTAASISLLFLRFQKAQLATEAANAKQKVQNRHLEDLSLLNEMGNRLQTCLTVAEAYDVIANFFRRLFPNVSGALYVLNKTSGILEPIATWGDAPLQLPGCALSSDECWALRLGKLYSSDDLNSHSGFCPSLGKPRPDGYLCVPLLAHDETLGILHFRYPKLLRTLEKQSAEGLMMKRQLSETVAEHAALALVNLGLQETLRYQAIRDPLTGLFNRRYMEETFMRELDRAARRKAALSVIMLDIDHFKSFNDTYSHPAGDAVLIELGELLKKNFRGEDIPCRYGGEEFLLILPEASLDDTLRRTEKLHSEIQRMNVRYQEESLPAITVSIGVASFPEHGETIESLLSAADSALYRAKNEGRNRFVVAQTSME